MKYEFPEDFLWGVATAAQQIEGAAYEGGRGPSIWDVFAGIPGKISNGDTPDDGCDHYHHVEDDVRLMKELGIKVYRFSFSWSRIIPDGDGMVNSEGIAFYRRLLGCLKANGIKANATMYHWDLPYMLQMKGGFGNREVVRWFTKYAEVLLENFGQDVDFWATFNEPIATYVGLAKGFFAPGLQDEKYARQAVYNLLLCHGETVKLFRQKQEEKKVRGKIGIVVDIWKHFAGRPGNPEDEETALYENEIEGYGMFLNPIFLGKYADCLMNYLAEKDMIPHMEDGDMGIISQPMDYFGLNFYNALIDNLEEKRRREAESSQEGGNYQNRPEIHTEKLGDVLEMLVEQYHVNIPIFITENGFPIYDSPIMEENMEDDDRIAYVREILIALNQAMQKGIDVRGYILWSLMDNFEWSAGYSARYGICYTDYKTKERIPKKSAKWYSKVICENGFEV